MRKLAKKTMAFDMYLNGVRAREIAKKIEVPKRTFLSWCYRGGWPAQRREIESRATENLALEAQRACERTKRRQIQLLEENHEVLGMEIALRKKALQDGKITEPSKLSDLNRAFKSVVDARTALMKPIEEKNVPAGPRGGMTFQPGAMCFVGVRPLGRTADRLKLEASRSAVAAPAIDTTAVESPHTPGKPPVRQTPGAPEEPITQI